MTLTKRLAALALTLLMLLSTRTPTAATEPTGDPSVPALANTQAACVMDAATGIVLYDKNAEEQHFPASVTKLMTVLLLLEYAEGNYAERVRFSNDAVFGIEPGSSHIAMDVDETLTIEQCLYAILLASANEVSAAVAEHVGGSIEGFAEMMTARAAELGCTDTNFVNPHGLHDAEHYTTAHDMALIMRAAAKHEIFRTVIGTVSYYIPPTEKQTEQRPLWNSNKLILGGRYAYEYNIGGKTGYTNEARHTLVTLHEKDGVQLIVAALQSEKYEIYIDTAALADYGFTRYADMEAVSKDDYRTEANVVQPRSGGGGDVVIGRLSIVPDQSLTLRLPIAAADTEIVQTPVLDRPIAAPVRAGEIVGALELRYAGAVVGSVNLVAAETVNALDSAALQALQSEQAEAVSVFGSKDSALDGQGLGGTGRRGAMTSALLVSGGAMAALLAVVILVLRGLQRRGNAYRRRPRRTTLSGNRDYAQWHDKDTVRRRQRDER